MAKKPRLHLDYIDGIRALAALYVVFVHTIPRVWGQGEPQNRLFGLIAKVLSGGHFAVTVFIVVSGFCLMLPVVRSGMTISGGTGEFFKRRYRRIAPTLYASFGLSVLLAFIAHHLTPVSAVEPLFTLTQLVGHLLILQFVVPHAMLANNPVLWSITVEWLIYLWFPLLVGAWRRFGGTRATLIFLAASYALSALFERTAVLSNVTISYLGIFSLGALAASIAYAPTPVWLGIRSRLPWNTIALIFAFCVSGLVIMLGWKRVYEHIIWFDLPVSLATCSILIGAGVTGQNRLRHFLEWRPLVFTGAFSYSLYAIHFPLAEIIFQVVPESIKRNQTIFAGVVVLLIVPLLTAGAFLFYRAFEMPFLARRSQKNRPTEVLAPTG